MRYERIERAGLISFARAFIHVCGRACVRVCVYVCMGVRLWMDLHVGICVFCRKENQVKIIAWSNFC